MIKHYQVTLTLTGPILTQSTTSQGFGIDAPMARDSTDQYYVLPGSLVKGKLRQGLEELAGLGLIDLPVEGLLGRISANIQTESQKEPVSPHRGRLQFTDFVCKKREEESPTRYRIQINEALGSVAKGQMLLMEAPFASGEAVVFTGNIRLIEAKEREAEELRPVLERGFRMITAIGAEKTIGFGRLKAVTVSAPEDTPAKVTTKSAPAKQMYFGLRFSGPFCIAKAKADDNLFEAEEVIPGGVIKGALAATWLASLGRPSTSRVENEPPAGCQHPSLWRHFASVRFSHVFPGTSDGRFVARPLSLTQYKGEGIKEQYRDVLMLDGPALHKEGNRFYAPAFQIDWKDDQNKIDADLPKPKLTHEWRIRTAIDRSSGAAQEQQLFGMVTIVPGDKPWLFRVDIPDELDGDVAGELAALLSQGIDGIGKTKVSGTVERQDSPWALPAMAARQEISGHVAITLQTPVLLGDPLKELRTAYEDYFSSQSGNSLKLVRYFAAQRLAGGYYLHRRFRDGHSYRPWLLTTEGSVFLLETVDRDAALRKIEEWERLGLPPFEKSDWRTCPYVRENGYGEILTDMAVHKTKMLGERERFDLKEMKEYGIE